MSKITFRADDDLVERLEACDASKSEVMREALRSHLEAQSTAAPDETAADTDIDTTLTNRIDELIGKRLDSMVEKRLGRGVAGQPSAPGDVTVNVSLTGAEAETAEVRTEHASEPDVESADRKTRSTEKVTGRGGRQTQDACGGCGERVPEGDVYCPNCGEKQSHRVFCECGDEVRTDWSFCPGCGRRTPAADVLHDR